MRKTFSGAWGRVGCPSSPSLPHSRGVIWELLRWKTISEKVIIDSLDIITNRWSHLRHLPVWSRGIRPNPPLKADDCRLLAIVLLMIIIFGGAADLPLLPLKPVITLPGSRSAAAVRSTQRRFARSSSFICL